MLIEGGLPRVRGYMALIRRRSAHDRVQSDVSLRKDGCGSDINLEGLSCYFAVGRVRVGLRRAPAPVMALAFRVV